MKKHLMLLFAFIVITTILFGLAGCGEHFPVVMIEESVFSSRIDIDIGHGYEYTGFDIETTDGGKDLVLHFVE